MLRITSSFVCLDLFDGFAQFPKKLGYRVTYILGLGCYVEGKGEIPPCFIWFVRFYAL